MSSQVIYILQCTCNEIDFTMAILMVYKRNSQFVDLSELVEKLSSLIIHLEPADQSKYYMLLVTGTSDEIIKLE
ncbi:MAG: hypothetical protein QOK64_04535 [Nitrososphaeraceae archaeon]|nr:hypothetical protein [Nitrososphaeraceae archaeon]